MRDEQLFGIIDREVERQNTTIQLIASENFTSRAVMEAQGSVLTNKYSEGYPGRRYYQGNRYVDSVESLAIWPITGSLSREPWPSGLQDSVTMFICWCTLRCSTCWKPCNSCR